MRICISGAGIAGPALAYWLERNGHEITIVERASQFRRGGYLIDFWGAAYDIADRMGISARIEDAGYFVKEVRLVDHNGARTAGFDTDVMRSAAGGRFVSLPRGELASIIYDTVKDRVETVFGNTITSVRTGENAAWAEFENGPRRRFDLVVGADGLHSKVRSLCFGAAEVTEKYLGYEVAAFEADGYRPRVEDVYVAYAIPGRQIARFSMRGDRTMFLMVFTSQEPSSVRSLAEQKALLQRQFEGAGWECAQIMEAMDRAESLYLDNVSQIRMPRWSANRVALLGDAAFCPSLLAGEGCALAMIGAYVLAGELASAGDDYPKAFSGYQQRLQEFILGKQLAAERFAAAFAPKTRLGLLVRRCVLNAMRLPGIASLFMGRSLRDELDLPGY